jgi:hypothetical protein
VAQWFDSEGRSLASVEELHKDIQDFIKLVCPKKVTGLQGRTDLELLDKIIGDWKSLSRIVKLEEPASERLGELIQKCVYERGKPHPLKNTVCKSLKEFNLIFYSKVVVEARAHQYGLVHHDLLLTLDRFETSLKDPTERDYFAEARNCIGNNLYRSFIVMSWNVVMYRLYKLVEFTGYDDFIKAYCQVYPRHKKPNLSSLEDFFDISDSQVIEVASNKSIKPHIIDKHQKEMLLRNLRIRNMAAHVSTSFVPRNATVLGYVEEIVDSFLSRT